MALYWAACGANPTTAALSPVSLSTSITTVVQVATPSTRSLKVVEYGVSFNGSVAAEPAKVELIQTDVAATVTSLTPTPWHDPGAGASLCIGGTSATGYAASAEGTITATRVADVQFVAPTSQMVRQYPLGREFGVPPSKFLRIRITASASVSVYAYVVWEEG